MKLNGLGQTHEGLLFRPTYLAILFINDLQAQARDLVEYSRDWLRLSETDVYPYGTCE